MDVPSLRKTHPQKYFLKIMCKSLYVMGMGDYWYEETKRSKTHKIIYSVWAVIINGFLILNTLNELLGNVRTDLTTKEKNDLIQFSLAHPSLSAKFIFLIFSRKRVKVLLKKLVDGDPATFRSLKVERSSVKKAIWYFVALSFVTYATLLMTTIDAFIAHQKYGIPFRVEVTLVPGSYHGYFASHLQFFVDLHWWCIVTNMVFVDGISFTCLIYQGYKFRLLCMYFDALRVKTLRNVKTKSGDQCAVEYEQGFVTGIKLHSEALWVFVDGISFTCLIYQGYKFRLLCMYFDALRVETLRNVKTKSRDVCAVEYEQGFVTGIKLHSEAFWCSRNVQYSLGNIYGVQIIESITLLVICLLKLVTFERNMTFLLANFFYISCLLTLNGAYMMAAGDVTYEASQLSTSMFHSGWELVRTRRRFRALAVLAIMNSQKPVYMTAFGVIVLSHRNFISVIRSSYSFFAVMY